jgi:hypothetical protein
MENNPDTSQPEEPAAPANARPGWQTPQPETLPAPTYWPVVMAAGIIFFLWGTVTTLIISLVGLVMFAIALAGWIGDLRHAD